MIFELSKYFNHFAQSSFKIIYDDFHLGFVPHLVDNEDKKEKMIIKLRGISSKNPVMFFTEESFQISGRHMHIQVNKININGPLKRMFCIQIPFK